MNILHLLYGGNIGGIERLCINLGKHGADTDNNYFLFSHPEGRILDEMKSSGLQVIEYDVGKYNFVALSLKINEVVLERKIDCIVIQHAAPLNWLAMLLYLKRKDRAKVIVYCHNEYSRITQSKIQKKILFNTILFQCDAVIAISKFVKTTLLNNVNLSHDKIKIIYNGTPQKKCENLEIESLNTKKSDKRIHIIYIGRLIEEKGVQLLIEAISMLNVNDIMLEIVGDGNYREEIEALVKSYNLKDVVVLYGEQPEVEKYLLGSDIFVHPAIWNEAFGITLIEAMSYGLVCIAFNKGAIPEIIDNEVNGFLVDECNAEALARSLNKTIDTFKTDRKLMEEIRKNAVNRSRDFSFDKYVQRLHDLYVSLEEQ